MAWVLILVAGVAETAFAGCLGASNGMTKPLPSSGVVVFGTLAVALLSRALRDIPLSTGYAAFTALGSLGATAIGIGLRDEPVSPARIAALGLVVAAVVALRLTAGADA
jgi:quaternary ammonium compound-resistance protein SugE